MSKTIPKIYDKSYLLELLEKDHAIPIDLSEKMNSTTIIQFQCKCNNHVKKSFKDIAYYGGAFCKECCKKNKSEKIKRTCIKRYGVSNPSCIQEIKDKKEETSMKKYGMHPRKTDEVKEKCKQTCLAKYNVDNPSKAVTVKEKIKETFIEIYGGHPMHNATIKKKVKDTCFDRYGGYPAESQEVKDKMNKTNMERYGCHPSQHPDIRGKINETNMERYGCHPSQTIEIQEKMQQNGKKYKPYIMPSGEIRMVQGYENYALNILVKSYKEEEIKSNRTDVPRISYINNNKQKYYFPDIYIPHMNLIIEVKSEWIYKCNEEVNKLKEKATQTQGYQFEFWIFNSKGIKVETIHSSQFLHRPLNG